MKISKKIKKIISECVSFKKDIKKKFSLKNDLEVDSLDMIELTMCIEETFKIKILDEEIEKIDTVKSLIVLVKKKINL
ncbi:phosphopantetheine-binding protein [Buchnera aphidicola]|uniref:phosphopantetheine-binding protein n=1 Tax=Buchnera aphidicola TaxID=9 RepID=UPI003463B226